MTRDLLAAARLPLTIAALAAVIVSGAHAAPVRAADPVFGTPTIDASFESGLTLEQPVTLDRPPQRVELLLTYADASGPLVIEMPPPSSAGSATLRYRSSESDGHVLPNTPVAARWRITPSQGADAVTGPTVEDVFDDQRFDWQTVSGDVVRVHWYEGDASFGERALRIGEQAVAATSDLLGVVEEEPVDFFIYADQAAFYDALGPGTRENVGGQAVAGIRTLFALIRPGEIDDPWVGTVVPHELVHLVFDTAVSNPYHFPPRWLNEGLAVYLSQGYDTSDRRMVDRAAADGTIVPLVGLVGQFPTSAERFFLAYAESVSAVDYLIREHGQEALVALDQVVRRRAHRRRGVQRSDRDRHDGFRRRLADGHRSRDARALWTTARAAGPTPGRLGIGFVAGIDRVTGIGRSHRQRGSGCPRRTRQ